MLFRCASHSLSSGTERLCADFSAPLDLDFRNNALSDQYLLAATASHGESVQQRSTVAVHV